MNIGAHVSIAGGIQNAPKNGANWGCEAIQIFTRPPQGGKAPELTATNIHEFQSNIREYHIKNVFVHTPYYINFASANNRIRYGSVSVVRNELERGGLIGAKYVMTHIGSAKEYGQKEAIRKVIEMLKKSLEGYHGTTKLLLENSAGAGEIIGDDLRELAEIIKGVNNPSVAGICLDTQHSFASGYNWLDFENTIKKVDKELGIEKIKLIHANDSQSDFNSHRDRHENIGKGKIGIKGFGNIVSFAKENNIDMICELEEPGVKESIKLLKKFRDTL